MSRDVGQPTQGGEFVRSDVALEALIEAIPAVMAAQHGEDVLALKVFRSPAHVYRTPPSRQFMIQQSVLDAMAELAGPLGPFDPGALARQWDRWIGDDHDFWLPILQKMATKHFRLLEAQYAR